MQKRALILDFLCIAVSVVVLYLGYKELIPQWGLITGALIALVLLVCSLYYFFKGRKLDRLAQKQEMEEMLAAEAENESKPQPEINE